MNATANISALLDRSHFYFVGIGGIGMSALARFFLSRGKSVGGYDKTPSSLTDQLSAEGMDIHFDDHPDHVKEAFKDAENTLIVYTPAIPPDHAELNYFRQKGFRVLKRSEVLGIISKDFFTIAIAGTHGKTTTSSMVSHLLQQAGRKFIAFVGGITQNYNSNIFFRPDADIMITEADEYDRSFLTLHPDVILITSLDPDHLDIYGDEEEMKKTYRDFALQLKAGGTFITTVKNRDFFGKAQPMTYSIDSGDFHAKNVHIEQGIYHFDLANEQRTVKNCQLGLPGRHNLENAIGAAAVARLLNVPDEMVKNALASYRGVKRRFELHINTAERVFIDDYAHHPNEIRACLGSVREMYPGKHITGVFQPHLYSRTRDFAADFADSLDLLDELIMLDIYPAREKPIEGVSSQMIIDRMKLRKVTLVQKSDLTGLLKEKDPEVLVTMGAGDIDRLIEPIKKTLSNA